MKRFIFLVLLSANLSAEVNWSHNASCPSPDMAKVEAILNKMTLREKVGQIIMPDIDAVTPELAKKYKLGSILNGGGRYPNKNKFSSIEDWKNLSKAYYEASPEVDGLTIPILWGTDAVHGHNNVIGATIFPHNIGLGATRNPELIKEIGEAVAKEVLSTGIPWTFAPTITVPQNDTWGRTYEGYSEDPELVASLGQAMIFGLQGEGDDFLGPNHMLATAKHFIADGGTTDGIDQGNAVISEMGLKNLHGKPYFKALDACVQTIMASFNSWNGKKLHGSNYLLTNILKQQMNFDGLVVGDWNGHGQVKGCTNTSCPQAFNAGVDIFMVPDEWQELYKTTIKQVKNGSISKERLNDAVRRILRVKMQIGLLNGMKPHEYKFNFIGDPEHTKIARRAVRESLVLLKNNGNLLPLDPNMHYVIIGEAAQSINSQMGGWTITWQARENKNSDYKNVQNIYTVLASYIISQGGSVEFSKDGSYKKTPDTVIAIYGEEPYAEGDGDRKDLQYQGKDSKYLSLMEKFSKQELPIVSIFLSGRPLEVNKQLNLSNAFVAAWLPGTAVEGIGDVIFTKKGQINYDFKGKLSYSWPKYADQNLNFKDANYSPLFPYGYGLNYSSIKNIVNIEEVNIEKEANEIILFIGSAYSPGIEFVQEGSNVEQIQSDIYTSKLQNISLYKFDYKKQDDAKNIKFFKSENYNAWGILANTLLDIDYMKNPHYEIDLKVNRSGKSSIYFGATCAGNGYEICRGTIDITKLFNNKKLADWSKIQLPISCLKEAGLDLSNMDIRSLLLTNGNWDIDIHSIKVLDNIPSKSIDCSNLTTGIQ
jgi:beta-glucosidase|tara:strand:- start:30289 stop:32748 length:2460 start_codon:yes stop_codon:yes gene_type:complete